MALRNVLRQHSNANAAHKYFLSLHIAFWCLIILSCSAWLRMLLFCSFAVSRPRSEEQEAILRWALTCLNPCVTRASCLRKFTALWSKRFHLTSRGKRTECRDAHLDSGVYLILHWTSRISSAPVLPALPYARNHQVPVWNATRCSMQVIATKPQGIRKR